MNCSPMILRFCSGSVTPASADEEAVLGLDVDEVDVEVVAEGRLDLGALVVAHQAVVDEHAGELVADRPVHQRGRDRGVHPAGQPAEDGAVPDLGADPLDQVLDDVERRPRRGDAGAVLEEAAQDLLAVGGVADLGVELHAEQAPVGVLDHRARGGVGGGRDRRPGPRGGDGVAVAHPHGLGLGGAGHHRGRVVHAQLGLAVLGDVGVGDLAAQRAGHQLLAVADAEDGDAELEDGRVHGRGALGVDRGRAAGEDDPGRLAGADLVGADGAGHDLAVDVGLADAAGDQLGVLRPEVHDEDGGEVGGHGATRSNGATDGGARGRLLPAHGASDPSASACGSIRVSPSMASKSVSTDTSSVMACTSQVATWIASRADRPASLR